jgi:NADPH:quinone reductase-like Zn-dependent oxidoreductase
MCNMKAVVISFPGPPEVLSIEKRAKPALGEAEVLIQVKAAGVNRADLIQREGQRYRTCRNPTRPSEGSASVCDLWQQ